MHSPTSSQLPSRESSPPSSPIVLTHFETNLPTTNPQEWYRTESEPGEICYLEIQIGSENVGRLGIRLYDEYVPKTAENFRRLCVGERLRAPTGDEKMLHYKVNNKVFCIGMRLR